jgi:hypothetical protein
MMIYLGCVVITPMILTKTAALLGMAGVINEFARMQVLE